MIEKILATEQWCDKSGAQPGSDNSTHHIVTGTTGVQRCRACKRTIAEIPTRTVPTIHRDRTFEFSGQRYRITGGGPGTPNASFGYEIHTEDFRISEDGFFRLSEIRDLLRLATIAGWTELLS